MVSKTFLRLSVFLLLLIAGCGGSQGAGEEASGTVVIAHRGASGYLPESTLPAYVLAYQSGADYLEVDLVMSRDGVPIVFHDLVLDGTTDVAEMFPGSARADGRWYVADFSVEELRQSNVFERFEGRFPKGAKGYSIPTFEAVLQLIEELNSRSGCDVGVYPEIKHPKYHLGLGLPMEAAVVNLLSKYGYTSESSRAYVQSFDKDSLIEIRYALQSDLKLVQLIGGADFDEMVTPAGLEQISDYAQGIGPSKSRVLRSEGALVRDAHSRGLEVHPYTFRADRVPDTAVSFTDELSLFVSQFGVDGVFTDHPDQVLKHLGRLDQPGGLQDRCRN